jgi:hypothetical protein
MYLDRWMFLVVVAAAVWLLALLTWSIVHKFRMDRVQFATSRERDVNASLPVDEYEVRRARMVSDYEFDDDLLPELAKDQPGHYLSFFFEAEADMDLDEFRQRVNQVFEFVDELAYLAGANVHRRDGEVQLMVHSIEYGSPFNLKIFFVASHAVTGLLTGIAVGINDALQHIRRSSAETGAIQSQYRAIESRNNARSAILDTLTESVLVHNIEPERLERIADLASALDSINYKEIESPIPPRQLEAPK